MENTNYWRVNRRVLVLRGGQNLRTRLGSGHANLLNIIALRSTNRCFYGLSLIVLNSWRGPTPSPLVSQYFFAMSSNQIVTAIHRNFPKTEQLAIGINRMYSDCVYVPWMA